jgi:hypothetical protein
MIKLKQTPEYEVLIGVLGALLNKYRDSNNIICSPHTAKIEKIFTDYLDWIAADLSERIVEERILGHGDFSFLTNYIKKIKENAKLIKENNDEVNP